MTILIVGGSSGLGLELAKILSQDNKVIITGRKDPRVKNINFQELNLTGVNIPTSIDKFVKDLPPVNCLVYAAGFYQEGRVTDLSPKDIEDMIDVGGRALIYFAKALLSKQGQLDELITITSTSQWTPRKLEPVYNFVKAGAGHFTNSLAEDGRIKKVLVVGPSGMKTDFWRAIDHPEWEKFLEPTWVAKQVDKSRSSNYRYKYVRILRDPARIEEVEKR